MDPYKLDWFYCESIPSKGTVRLSDDEARHLKVKRHNEDEFITLFNGKGVLAVAKVTDKKHVEVQEVDEVEDNSSLTIATAVPKGDKADFMVQKLVELNVKTIIPLKTKYSVVIPKNTDRWNRITLESCKQCKRAHLPEIKKVHELNEVVKMKADIKLILDQQGRKANVSNKDALILIGPEGGFTDEEFALAEKNGFTLANISKNVLRIETAAIAAASIFNQ